MTSDTDWPEDRQSLPDLYDEVHIWHAAHGANFAYADEERIGQSYLSIIQRRSRQPRLTVYEATDAIRGFRIEPSRMAGWRFQHKRITEVATPRCIKIVLTATPPEAIGIRGHRQRFAAYDQLVPTVNRLLPSSWTWFLDQLRGQQLDAHSRRSRKTATAVASVPSTPPPLSMTDAQFVAELATAVRQGTEIDRARRQLKGRFDVSCMATMLGTTRRTLERRLQACLGLSAAAHIMRLRLDLGRELLGNGISVKETAHRIGYTPAHMARLFSEHFQANPSSFRR